MVGIDRHAADRCQLAGEQGQPDAGDVADENGLGQQFGNETQPEDAGDEGDYPDKDPDGGHQSAIANGVTVGELPRSRRGQDGRARLRSDAEVTARADDRIDGERDEGGAESGRRGESAQLGIGHGLRDEHRGDGEPREHVRANPRSLVVSLPNEPNQGRACHEAESRPSGAPSAVFVRNAGMHLELSQTSQ